MIAQRLSEIPVTALPATRIDKTDVFELTVNVSWFEALKYMVEKRISAVPVKDGDSYIGYIDRFTFVHWAAQYAKKSMAQQGEHSMGPATPKAISDEITQIFTTHPLTQFERTCFHPMVLIKETATVSDVADYLKKPGVYRVYLTTEDGTISGVVTQQNFFSWLVKQEFVKENPKYKAAVINDLVNMAAEHKKTKQSYRTFDLNDKTYTAITSLKRNPDDKGMADGCVMLGEDDLLVTVLRRRDLDILAKIDDLTVLCAPLNRMISIVRNTEINCTVTAITVSTATPVEAVAMRLAISRFEHAFVASASATTWHDIQDIITDGRIIRFILSL
ncbi:Hypothetical protein DHA2_8692 [Giardia duodenalis]|uniref:CBS domain-containing protein n=1 Tax=Giardia intestinalis TaxID=5741 RepID=V6TH46_GIAIN|nr:Hypothetical protein DHA2_8692 [Giardia intestinalis]